MRYYSSDVMKTASVDVQLGWATYVRAADEAAAAATPKKEEQLGEWYLRTAELYAETAGDAAAQQVVEQVRGALLNSADREQCYLIRARAYLQLANFDNAKRDLGAVLRTDPEHTAAKTLHRKVKKYTKSISDAEELEKARQWVVEHGSRTSAHTHQFSLLHHLLRYRRGSGWRPPKSTRRPRSSSRRRSRCGRCNCASACASVGRGYESPKRR